MTTTNNTTTKKMVAPTMFYTVEKMYVNGCRYFFWVLNDIHGKGHLVTKENFPKMPSKSILKLAHERNRCIVFYGDHWRSDNIDTMEMFKQGRLEFNF